MFETLDGFVKLAVTFPWLLLVAFTLPLALLAWFGKIYPGGPLAIVAALPVVLWFGLLFVYWQAPEFTTIYCWVVGLFEAALVLIAAIDLLTVPWPKSFSAQRECGRVASLGKSHPITLTINNHSRRSLTIVARDDLPQEFERNPKEFKVYLQRRNRATLHYEVTSMQRGAFNLAAVFLRVRSFIGLWKRIVSVPVETTIHVYPDMKQLGEYAMLARKNRLSLMGVRRTRRIGQDNEFERLRDFTRDDNYKHIDWRTTARRRKLTVKDFQTNQSQRIIFLIDCGRMMTNEAAGLSLLDHSFNAMLMLSYVALQQGDSVGLICFSDQVHTFVPPRGGMKQMTQLLHASFDRFPQLVESRYDQAFLYLSAHCQKRAMVVLMSNIIDEVNAHQMEQYLSTLVGRHLPLGVLMRDHRLFEAVDHGSAYDPEHMYKAAAAAEILSWRHQVLTDLEHKGVLSLDVFPEDMTARLVNRYLEVKARHLL